MKKILKLNAVIVILLATILMFFNYKNNDAIYWTSWGKIENSQSIYLRNTGYVGSDLYEIMSQIAKEVKVNLIKTDYVVENNEEKIIKSIYLGDEKNNLFAHHSLHSGQWLTKDDNDSNQYLSTKETQDPLCKGHLFDFLDDNQVEIWTLTRFMQERGSLDGDYIVSSHDSKAITTFINELSNQTGIKVEDLTQQKTFVSIEKSPVETMTMVGIIISLFIFVLLVMFYAIQNSKQIGIMKLHGYSNLFIWESLISSIFFTMVLFAIILDIFLVFFIKNNAMNFMFAIFKIELFTIFLMLLASMLIYAIIKRNKISNLIKNKKTVKHILSVTYAVKSVILFVLVIFSIIIGSGLQQANEELSKMKHWEAVGDFGVLVNLKTGDDAQSIRQGGIKLSQDFANYYSYLEKEGAIYTNVMTFSPHTQFQTKYDEATGSYGYVDYFQHELVTKNYTVMTFQINDNYLKRYPLYDTNGNKIEVSNRKERLILIPESKQHEQKQLEEIYKASYIDSIKSSERRQGIINDTIPEVQIRSVIYKEDPKGYFTFSTAFEASNYVVHTPIFEVLNDENMTFLEKSNISTVGLSSLLKLDLKGVSSKQFNQDIISTLKTYHLDDNELKYMTINEVFSTQINVLKSVSKQYMLALIIIFLVMIMITFHLARLFIEAKKQKYCVEKLYGYSFIERYKKILSFEVLSTIIIIVVASLFTLQAMEAKMTVLSLGIIGLLFILNILIISILIRFFEQKSISQMVKGQ